MPGVSTFSLETIINIDGSPVFWVALQREESKAHVTKDKTNLALGIGITGFYFPSQTKVL